MRLSPGGGINHRDHKPMFESDDDPRVYFAAERTMLAWLRTGIAIMAFGFVVARFGLFLRLLRAQGGRELSHGVSPYLGAALVVLGVVATAGGALQYQRYVGSLPAGARPKTSSPRFVLGLSWALVLVGVVLALVLLA
jgi:putative membrane protein